MVFLTLPGRTTNGLSYSPLQRGGRRVGIPEALSSQSLYHWSRCWNKLLLPSHSSDLAASARTGLPLLSRQQAPLFIPSFSGGVDPFRAFITACTCLWHSLFTHLWNISPLDCMFTPCGQELCYWLSSAPSKMPGTYRCSGNEWSVYLLYTRERNECTRAPADGQATSANMPSARPVRYSPLKSIPALKKVTPRHTRKIII